MKKYTILQIVLPAALLVTLSACMGTDSTHHDHSHSDHKHEGDKAKPVQHLKLEDITSLDVAIKTFHKTTKEIKSKSALSPQDMAEIHIITYSLEKAIAYFSENLKGEGINMAEKMAVVVEEVHLASENNQKENCKKNLDKYFKLVNSFKKYLK